MAHLASSSKLIDIYIEKIHSEIFRPAGEDVEADVIALRSLVPASPHIYELFKILLCLLPGNVRGPRPPAALRDLPHRLILAGEDGRYRRQLRAAPASGDAHLRNGTR